MTVAQCVWSMSTLKRSRVHIFLVTPNKITGCCTAPHDSSKLSFTLTKPEIIDLMEGRFPWVRSFSYVVACSFSLGLVAAPHILTGACGRGSWFRRWSGSTESVGGARVSTPLQLMPVCPSFFSWTPSPFRCAPWVALLATDRPGLRIQAFWGYFCTMKSRIRLLVPLNSCLYVYIICLCSCLYTCMYTCVYLWVLTRGWCYVSSVISLLSFSVVGVFTELGIQLFGRISWHQALVILPFLPPLD